MNRFAVVIPYFNPVGYQSHAAKLARCLEAFDRAGMREHTFVSGAGWERPPGAGVVFWDEQCQFMWHKERLVNLAAGRLAKDYTHLVWADSDVLVGAGWAESVGQAFERSSVVHCFRRAHFLTPGSFQSRSRVSCLTGGSDGTTGLLWGSAMSMFTRGPGLFELALVGSGDAVFGRLALNGTDSVSAPWCRPFRSMLQRLWSPELLAAHDRWQRDIEDWLGSVVAVAADTEIEVIEHGPLPQRQYVERHALLGSLVPERHLLIRAERVMQWSPEGLTTVEPAIRAYFRGRAEDEGERAGVTA